MAARNRRGEIAYLPLVESRQEQARCLWVKGPIKLAKMENLKKRISRFLNRVGYEGIIAFELFDSRNELIINELAPRVHNSGHYSLDALSEDQFTLHLKAIVNARLRSPHPLGKGFAMLNLLGEKSITPRWQLPAEIKLHWYGKKDNRPGRKMGHINVVGSSPTQALNKVLRARKEFQL